VERDHARELLPVAYIRACIPPSRTDALLSRAQSKFVEIRYRGPDQVARSPCDRIIPRVLVQLGELRGVIYASDRSGDGVKRTYIHFMERPPMLACNAGGDQLYIVGGNYRVTSRGIEG